MQVPVKKHDAIERHLEPQASDSFSFPGNLDKERRHLVPFEPARPPARINVPIERYAPVQDNKKVDVGVRGLPPAGERAKKDEPIDTVSPALEHRRRKILQGHRPARAARGQRQRNGGRSCERVRLPPAEKRAAVSVERHVRAARFLLQPLMQGGRNAQDQGGTRCLHGGYAIMIAL